MNHAEKAEPLPPCRGFIKGGPARGGSVLLCLLDIMPWAEKFFDFRNILSKGEVEFFLRDINDELSGPHRGLYESKYNNFSIYVDKIFLNEDDLCSIIKNKYGENIHADIVRRWLKMSPMQFIDFMNSGQGPVSVWEEGFRRHSKNLYPDGPFFNTSDLQNDNFTFHVLDWLNWQKARNVESKAAAKKKEPTKIDLLNKAICIASLESQLATLKAELEQVRHEKAALQVELEKTRTELEQVRHEDLPQGMTSQQKAAQARSEKTLAVWKPVMAAMIEIAVTIGKEGPKERQTPDLYVYFNERDVILSSEQMKFFRRALPPAYKDTKGGAVGKI